jgi:hypothetical protein
MNLKLWVVPNLKEKLKVLKEKPVKMDVKKLLEINSINSKKEKILLKNSMKNSLNY